MTHKADIRQANEARILRAAEKVFARDGYRGATTERIAQEAGLPKSNVHYYFGTKKALYRRVLEDILDAWMSAAESFDATERPEDALTAYVTAKMAFSRERPDGSRVWAREVMAGAPVIEEFLATTLKSWVQEKERAIRRWQAAGAMGRVDPRALLYLIWSATQHYADFEHQITILNESRRLSGSDFDARTQEVVRLILGSVGLSGQRYQDRKSA